MKRKHTMKLIIVMGFLILSLAAVGSITAFEDQATECGSCHETAGVLTLASNSTTVTATTGTPFLLEIDAGNGAEWVSITAGWAGNSDFAISESHIQDGATNDTNGAVGEISVAVTFTPLSPGSLTIRIWTASASDLASSIDVDVTVTGPTITITTTTTPPDPSEGLYEIWVML
ncbi:MAG: hypothetical protein ACXAB5_03720, partial [Candidatus Thorarchaeota archaeon]